jgi:hypothetical protein
MTTKKQSSKGVAKSSSSTPLAGSPPAAPLGASPAAAHAVAPKAVMELGAALVSFVPKPERYDPAKAKTALATLLPRLTAHAEDALLVPRLDARGAALAALGVHALTTQASPLRARFESQHAAGEFEVSNLDLLRDTAFVVLLTYAQAEAAGAFATDVKVPAATIADAVAREARMQELCEYKFKRDAEIRPILDMLRPGTGYRDLAGDLIGYADIYDRRPDEVASDTTNYDPTDAAEARRLAGEIYAHIAASMTPKAREAYTLLLRAWTLFFQVYTEVQKVGLYLLRFDPKSNERFPSLYAVARAPRSRGKKAADSGGTGTPPGGEPSAQAVIK